MSLNQNQEIISNKLNHVFQEYKFLIHSMQKKQMECFKDPYSLTQFEKDLTQKAELEKKISEFMRDVQLYMSKNASQNRRANISENEVNEQKEKIFTANDQSKEGLKHLLDTINILETEFQKVNSK